MPKYNYGESWFTENYINKSGICVPVFPFIHSLLATPKMLTFNKQYFLEDDQTSIRFVFILRKNRTSFP